MRDKRIWFFAAFVFFVAAVVNLFGVNPSMSAVYAVLGGAALGVPAYLRKRDEDDGKGP